MGIDDPKIIFLFQKKRKEEEMNWDWLSYFGGVITVIIVYSFVLPDSWSTWLSKRKNFPPIVLGLGTLLLLVGGLGIFKYFVEMNQRTPIQDQYLWFIIWGLVVVVLTALFDFLKRRVERKRKINERGGVK